MYQDTDTDIDIINYDSNINISYLNDTHIIPIIPEQEEKIPEQEEKIPEQEEKITKRKRPYKTSKDTKNRTLCKYDNTGILNETHTLTRGRGRVKQLNKMTNKEKRAERKAIMERNRIAAQEFRKRKKNYIQNLKCKVQTFIIKCEEQDKEIINLNKEVSKLKKLLNYE